MNTFSKVILRLSTSLVLISAVSNTLPPQLPNFGKPANAQTLTASSLYQQANPAVVTIKHGDSMGSGFIISPDGLIITNAHVVENASRNLTVRLHNGKEMTAHIVGFAKNGLDLAALRINSQEKLPVLSLAQVNSIKVGHPIYAIGTPLSEKYQNTLTQGIINKFDADNRILIHDAKLQPGNSGGPLLNENGQVIGVNYGGDASRLVYGLNGHPIGRTTTGLNYAISSTGLRSFLHDLDRGNIAQTSTVSQRETSSNHARLPLDGSPVHGDLNKGEKLDDGRKYHFFHFQGSKKQRLQILLKSTEFDPTMALFHVIKENGEYHAKLVAHNDDAAEKTLNSQLHLTLPDDGYYAIGVTSAQPGEFGFFTLQAL